MSSFVLRNSGAGFFFFCLFTVSMFFCLFVFLISKEKRDSDALMWEVGSSESESAEFPVVMNALNCKRSSKNTPLEAKVQLRFLELEYESLLKRKNINK